MMNGVVYAGFGSHCDNQPYQGWVVGVSTAGKLETMWATAPNGGAIWQAGGGLISDGPGQILFTTGNGFGEPGEEPPPGPGNKPPSGLGQSVVRVEVQGGDAESDRLLLAVRKRQRRHGRPRPGLLGADRAPLAVLRHEKRSPPARPVGQEPVCVPAEPRQSRGNGSGPRGHGQRPAAPRTLRRRVGWLGRVAGRRGLRLHPLGRTRGRHPARLQVRNRR